MFRFPKHYTPPTIAIVGKSGQAGCLTSQSLVGLPSVFLRALDLVLSLSLEEPHMSTACTSGLIASVTEITAQGLVQRPGTVTR